MSQALVLALPVVGLVAADTRLNLSSVTGEKDYNDGGPINIQLATDLLYAPPAAARKVRRIPGGWAAGAGEALQLEACLSALSSVPPEQDPVPVVASIGQRLFPRLRDVLPGSGAGRTQVATCRDNGTRFELSSALLESGEASSGVGQDYLLAQPPEISPDRAAQARQTFAQAFLDVTNEAGLVELLGRVGALFLEASRVARTVSGQVQLGVSLRTPSGVVHMRGEYSAQDLVRDPRAAFRALAEAGPSSV